MKQPGTPPTISRDSPPKALEAYVVKHNGMGRAAPNPHQGANFLTGTCSPPAESQKSATAGRNLTPIPPKE